MYKVEDSLKRLHKVRQSKSTAANLSSMTSATMSDDDKIRLQLVLDITEFGAQLEEKFGYTGESNYESLYELVVEINQSQVLNAIIPSNNNIMDATIENV